MEESKIENIERTEADVPAINRTSDDYILIDACGAFKYQVRKSAQTQDIATAFLTGSPAIKACLEHSLRIKAADELRSFVASLLGVPAKEVQENYRDAMKNLTEEEISKVNEHMIDWQYDPAVTRVDPEKALKTMQSKINKLKALGMTKEELKELLGL